LAAKGLQWCRWGIQSFGPGELRDSTPPLLEWVAATGSSRAAVHFDVDTIDSNEIVLGLGAEPGGLTCAQVRRIVADLDVARARSDPGRTSLTAGRACWSY
jgi:arginase